MDRPPKGVVPAAAEHATALASSLRAEHAREIWEICGLDPETAIRLSLDISVEAYALVDRRGEAVFLMGVEAAGLLTGSSLVWMVGSPAMDRRPAAVLRAAVWGMRRAFAVTGAVALEQYIPAWYGTGLRFARRLGFNLIPCGRMMWRVVAERDCILAKEITWESRTSATTDFSPPPTRV